MFYIKENDERKTISKDNEEIVLEIIALLKKKEDMTVERASNILSDAQGILPIITKI